MQDLGVTTGQRGTFDVLNREGVLAATRHYFDGKLWALGALSPLLLVVGLTYVFGFGQLLCFVAQRKWFMFFVFLAFFEYYVFIPGPVSMPRYHLPSLVLLCIFAGMGLVGTLARKGKGGRGSALHIP